MVGFLKVKKVTLIVLNDLNFGGVTLKMSHHLQEKTIEELQILFDKQEDPDRLNDIMKIIFEKEIASDYELEENNYITLEEDLYQQMGLMKLDDLDFLPLEVVQQKIVNKLGKRVMDNNDVGEEISNENINVNNVIKRPRYQGEKLHMTKTHTRFSVKVMFNQIPKQEEVTLEPISQTGYKLRLDGVRDRQDILDQWKKSMSSVLNLNTEWTSRNFLNYIEHSFYGCLEDWYDGIDKEVKTSESPTRMFRQLCQYIELEFIDPRADLNEKRMEYQRKLSNLSICNMKYVENYIMEFETYYYKIGENETNLGMFYDKLPSPLNEEISEKYQEWKEKYIARDALGNRIASLRKWIEKKCREVAGTQQMKRQFLTCWDFPNNYRCE
ncbi:uncharacterized protein LOC110695343 [Chenopodium quinoa]|uniref:uncharacterized protein LOC110695343 n=1 Tax=Chenopodium quinoa TaxID=63459 RepID=UPI000B78F937|nr:uncharacterized protein LOC110695343 [Chenopodium quinoa]